MALLQVLPDPVGMTWERWIATVTGFNPYLQSLVPTTDPWKDFAQRFCEVVPQAPQPTLFSTWQDWARAVKWCLGV